MIPFIKNTGACTNIHTFLIPHSYPNFCSTSISFHPMTTSQTSWHKIPFKYSGERSVVGTQSNRSVSCCVERVTESLLLGASKNYFFHCCCFTNMCITSDPAKVFRRAAHEMKEWLLLFPLKSTLGIYNVIYFDLLIDL